MDCFVSIGRRSFSALELCIILPKLFYYKYYHVSSDKMCNLVFDSFTLVLTNLNIIFYVIFKLSLLPYDAMRCTVFVIVILSVRLSVRLSVTLVDCVHMVRPTIMTSSPYGSPIILVSGDITFILKFEGCHPERGR